MFQALFDIFIQIIRWYNLNILSIEIAYIPLRWWIVGILLYSGILTLITSVGFPQFHIKSKSKEDN